MQVLERISKMLMLYFFKREKKFRRIHSFSNCLSVCSVLDGKMRNTLKLHTWKLIFFNAKVVGILRNNVCLERSACKQINKSGERPLKNPRPLKVLYFPINKTKQRLKIENKVLSFIYNLKIFKVVELATSWRWLISAKSNRADELIRRVQVKFQCSWWNRRSLR